MFVLLAGIEKQAKEFDKLKSVMLDCKASLISASKYKMVNLVKFVKNLQPISVGV
jgi:hypothetical protein